MKPHLRMRLRRGARHRPIPTWHGVELVGVTDRGLRPDVDAVFRRHRRSVWFTHEFEPSAPSWTADERRCGLDRVIRVVSHVSRPFPAALVDELRALPAVAAVGTMPVAAVPIASMTMSARRPSDWAGQLIGLDDAHRMATGSPDVVVAVLDTGVDLQHPELTLVPGRDLVDIVPGTDTFVGDAIGADDAPEDPGVGHGTHVSGIVNARGLAMPRGVAPGCRVMPVRVLGALERDGRLIGAGLVDNIDNGIKWAVDAGASVINMSLGIRRVGGGLPHARVIAYAERRGVVVVAASGNDGTDELYYPGSLPGVLAVGAVDREGAVPTFSTWGRQVDLVAPGVEIYSSMLDGGYGYASGTSQASPFVAGAAALLRSYAQEHGSALSQSAVARLLVRTANRPDGRWRDRHFGAGVLDVRDALRHLDLDHQTRARTA